MLNNIFSSKTFVTLATLAGATAFSGALVAPAFADAYNQGAEASSTINDAARVAASGEIVINRGIEDSPKIAIANFNYLNNAAPQYRIEDIVANDLNYSGRFQSVRANEFPQDITGTINAPLWLERSLNLLVTGEVTPTTVNGQPGFSVHYKLFDISGAFCDFGTACLDRTFSLEANKIRELGHRVSNDLFEKYYKTDGDFLSKIAFVRQPIPGVENYELFISDYDGFNAKKIFSSNTPISSPAWSADNSKLAFSVFSTFSSIIREVDFASGKIKNLVSKLGNNSSPSYSPDGRFLAYSHTENGKTDVYVRSLQSGNEINITRGIGRNTEPTWYGDTLIFTSDRGGVAAIYQSNLNGSDIRKISRTRGQTTNAEVAQKVSLMTMINQDRITTQDLKTGEVKQIANTYLDESITLSPNGYMAIYSSSAGQKKILNLLTTDGLFRARLPFGSGNLYYPAWSN